MTNHYPSSTGLYARDAIQSLDLNVDDHQIHYLRTGNGPPVILLHGGASDCQDWLGTMAILSDSYSLYAPDLIGFGLSSRNSSGYHLSDFVEFTLRFIQKMGLNSPVLVGHSLGGRVCLEIALRHSEMIRKLVVVDTVGFGRLTRWGLFLGIATWAVRKTLRRPQPYPKFLWKDSEDKDWLCLEELPTLQVPTLIVWNRHDPYHPLGGALKAKELIPESHLECFPGYGHAPHVKRSDRFSSLLRAFMEPE
jgi:pimeloyl-ACP methyl ester carboxylesterase